MNFQSRDSHSNLLFKSNPISKLDDKILTENIRFINKSLNNLLPLIFKSWFTFCSNVHNYQTVSSTSGKIFKLSYRTDSYGKHSVTISKLQYVIGSSPHFGAAMQELPFDLSFLYFFSSF